LVPFILLIVISYIALRLGDIAGVAGTICAALLFATILFVSRRGLAISNPVERNRLISMVILGVCVSELLGRRKGAKDV
jgi:K+-sensing histidine kinase KdpD